MLVFCTSFTSIYAQVFQPTSTIETNFPTYSFNAIAPAAVPGLYASSHYSQPFSNVAGSARYAEVSSWTEDDGKGWENGTVAYGYTFNNHKQVFKLNKL